MNEADQPARIVWRCPEKDCDWRLNTMTQRPVPEDEPMIRRLGNQHYDGAHPDADRPWAIAGADWRDVMHECGYPAPPDALRAVLLLLNELGYHTATQAHR